MKKQLNLIVLLLAMLAASGWAYEVDTKPVDLYPNIKLTGFARVRFTWDFAAGKVDGFSIPNARLGLKGAIGADFSYTLMVELASTDNENRKLLYDAYIDTTLVRKFRIRLGQFKYAFGLEQSTPDADLELISKSDAVVALLKPTRDIGLQVDREFALGKGKATLMLAMINGSGSSTEDENHRKSWVGRALIQPLQGLTLGGSFYAGSVGGGNDVKSRTGIEAAFERGKLMLKGEYLWGRDKQVDKSGFYATLGYTLFPSTVLLLRYDRWNPDHAGTDVAVSRLTVGVNRFFGKNVLWRTDFEHKMEAANVANDVIMTQVQVKF